MVKNKHVILTTATATASASVGSAGAAVAGDSLQMQSIGTKCAIFAAWATMNVNAGFVQMTSPNSHDRTRGYRAGLPANTAGGQNVLPLGAQIPLTQNETVDVLIGANAVAGDVDQLSYLTVYNEFRGQTFMDWKEVESKREKETTIEASLVSSAGPGYSGTALINAGSDLLIPNREYALLGFSSRTAVHCIGIVGPDTGNARLGCPGFLRHEVTQQWFKLLSAAHGEPFIPVIQANSKGQTSFFVATDENAGTFVVTAHLVLLK